MTDKPKTPEAISDADLDSAQGGLILNLSIGVVNKDEETTAASEGTRFDPYKNFKFRVR